jgi:cell division protein FtsX
MKTLFRSQRLILLVVGLLLTTTTLLLVGAVSTAIIVQVEDDLQAYWRTTYDILVRPSGSRSLLEEKYGLVEANHLSGIPGGITFEQYEAIKAIPGVEVAAPIAMIGYIPQLARTDDMQLPATPGVYLVEEVFTVDDGARLSERGPRQHFYYVGADTAARLGTADSPIVNHPAPVRGFFEFPFLVAGIVPSQEAALIGLDQALIEGEYLIDDEPINLMPARFYTVPDKELIAPVLINNDTYVSMTVSVQLKRVELPPEVSDFEAIMTHGGNHYLATLPAEVIDVQEMDTRVAYRRLLEQLGSGPGAIAPSAWDIPSRIMYREIEPPFRHNGLVLEIVLPESQQRMWQSNYRSFTGPDAEEAGFLAAFGLGKRGIFDIERIPRPADVSRVPLETYYPPVATLYYSEEGLPLEPRTLRPTTDPSGYIQSPPLVLTTLEAAHAIRGEDAISAVRVRVGSIDELTPAAQRKIETIAGEIARVTTLEVDIMVGSSPTRILVHVPGVGYVEEQWIQKNVTIAYQERVQTGHLLLMATLLGIGGLFVLDLAWAEVIARRRTIALQKALGWRSSSVFAQVLGQMLLVGLAAALLSLPLAAALIWLLDWVMPPLAWLAGVPLLVVVLSLLGGLYPAWLAARVPPIVGLRQGGENGRSATARFLSPTSLLFLAWQGLTRRWSRSLLGALTAALSAALLVLLLSVTLEQQGALSGTLLGEFILVRIEGYHYAIVAIGFALAALSLANSLLAGVLERRREIGVLKAVGWRTVAVTRLFISEGVLLGLLGGVTGAILGLAVFAGLYEALSQNLLWIALVGIVVPVIVGTLAATYPARVAASVPPAEAVRFE